MKTFNQSLMKLIGGTILAGGILVGGLYLYNNTGTNHISSNLSEPVKTVRKEMQNKMHETLIIGNTAGKVETISSNKKPWETLLESNPTLRMRIVGMLWYRDCLSGKMDDDTCLDYMDKVKSVDILIEEKRDIFKGIEYQPWWQKYLSGVINPENILVSYLPAVEQLVSFEKKSPDLYSKIAQSSLWNNAQDPNDPYNDAIIYQARLIHTLQELKDITNPEQSIAELFQRYNLETEALYTTSSIEELNIRLGKMNSIIIIEKLKIENPQKYQRFINSIDGKKYLQGTADLSTILTILENL